MQHCKLRWSPSITVVSLAHIEILLSFLRVIAFLILGALYDRWISHRWMIHPSKWDLCVCSRAYDPKAKRVFPSASFFLIIPFSLCFRRRYLFEHSHFYKFYILQDLVLSLKYIVVCFTLLVTFFRVNSVYLSMERTKIK